MTYKTGTVGDFMRWTMTVAKDPKRASEQPKQWFDSDATAEAAHATKASPEAIVKLLSEANLELLKAIGTHEYTSMRELAESVGRKESNLSVTLKKLADVGIVKLEMRGKKLLPRLAASRVTLDLDLIGLNSIVSVIHPAHR